jgi:hypothetical protein
MDMLATEINVRDAREIIQHLPEDRDDVYGNTMKRVEAQPDKSRKLAEYVFSWIIYAYRQLSPEELQHAVAVSSYDMRNMDPDALVNEAILTSVCAGLVVVDKESNVVRLVRK